MHAFGKGKVTHNNSMYGWPIGIFRRTNVEKKKKAKLPPRHVDDYYKNTVRNSKYTNYTVLLYVRSYNKEVAELAYHSGYTLTVHTNLDKKLSGVYFSVAFRDHGQDYPARCTTSVQLLVALCVVCYDAATYSQQQ